MASRRVVPLRDVLNEVQHSVATHRKYVKELAVRRRSEPEALAQELLSLLRHALVVSKREPAVERLVRFVAALATARDGDEDGDEDAFAEALLGLLVPLTGASDKAVRFRSCQLVAAVLNGLTAEAGLTDDLYLQLSDAMTERLRDKAPAVRAEASRALARLQDPGESGDFAEDPLTTELLQALACDKHKEVRKAVVASLGVSDATLPALVDRTRDVADDVRRTTFRTLADKVPLAALSIAQRTTVLRRGLADRAPPVREAAIGMLDKWMQACDGDVVRLLGALDVENRESLSEELLKEFISCSVVKAADVAQRDAAVHGLRRDVAADGPLSPELALYWRIICETLTAEAAEWGSGAATGGGQAAAVAAATASEKLEALEAALPESMEALCTLIRDHADLATPGAVFATRQLLRLASAQDLSDAAAAKAGGALADQLMRQGPLKDAATRGVTADWEAALVAFASAALGAAAPPTVLAAALAVVEAAPEDDAAWLHALALTAALLQGAASLRAAGGTALVRDGLLRDLVLPAVQHSSCAVRAAGMRSLGLVCVLDSQLDAAYVALLRHAAAGDARLVRCQATRALCDLALLHGLPALDGCLPPAALPAAGPSAATAPLLAALQQCLVEPAQGLAAPAQGAGGDADDVEEEPRTVAAEGLAKLLLLTCASSAGAAAPGLDATLAELVVLHQAADEHAHPRLAQCLTVFLTMFASASAQHKQLVTAAALPALRLGAKRLGPKRLPALGAALQRMVAQPLAAPRGEAPAPEKSDAGMTALATALLAEVAAAEGHFVRSATLKPYLAALVRVACATTPQAPDSLGDAQEAGEQAVAVARLRRCASIVSDQLGDKTLAKELAAWSARLGALPGVPGGEAVPDDVALGVLTALHEYWLDNVAATLPYAPSDGAKPAKRAGRAKAVDKAPLAASRPVTRTRGAKATVAVPSSASDDDGDDEDGASDFSAASDDSDDDAPRKAQVTPKRGGRAALVSLNA